MTQRRPGWSTSRRGLSVALPPAMALLVAASTLQAAPGTAAALRRACATGALTAYTCAQHGVVAPTALQPSSATASSPQEPARPSASPRDRRRRTSADAGRSARPFQDTQNRYDLDIPDGWLLKMQGGLAAFTRGDAWVQLRAADGATPQSALAAGVVLLRDQYNSLRTRSEADATVGGRAGRRLVLSAVSRAGRPSSLEMLAAPLPDGRNLLVIAGGDPMDADAIGSAVSDIARTLHFH